MDGPIHSSYFNRQQSNYKMHFLFTQSQLQENKPSSTGLTSTTYQNLTPSLDVFVYGLQIFFGLRTKASMEDSNSKSHRCLLIKNYYHQA